MDKVKKIALIILIWLLTLFFISLVQIWPIQISITTATFFKIPIIYWIVMLVCPFLLYLIAKDSENPLVPLLCVTIYFFIFYSFGLYFLSHPTITDVESSGQFQSILSSITHVNNQGFDNELFVSTARYFRWPLFFIFSKMFTSILGIGPIQTLNLGFFSLLLIMPFLLSLYYKRTSDVENFSVYFFLPALYLTLGWHFINDQFVPQFLALLYLFVVFGCYLKYKNTNNPLFMALMVIFYALMIFTHAFMHIFFLVAIIFEAYWSEYIEMKRAKFASYGLVIILVAMMFPYLDIYYEMAASAVAGGESFRIFQDFFSQSTPSGTGTQVKFLYHLVPRIYDQITSEITRATMVLVFSSITIGLFFYIRKKRSSFDLNILIGSASWFILGFAKLVLGQRALQVAALPLARHFRNPHKYFSRLSIVISIIVLISPLFFVATSMVNSSIQGERLIQDVEENIAGRFMDNHLTDEPFVLCAQNPYPTGFPSGFKKVGNVGITIEMATIMLNSAKLQKRFMFINTLLPGGFYDSVVYDNKDIEMVLLDRQIE